MAHTQMASFVFLTLFLLANLAGVIQAQPSWNHRELVVKQGSDNDNIVITCSINVGRDPFAVVRIVRQFDDGEKVIEDVITENDEVKQPYADMGRYHVKHTSDWQSGDNVVKLSIEEVRGEDSGRYGCLNIDDDKQVAFMDVEVQVPIEDVYMISISDATEIRVAEGATVHMEEGKDMGVGCVVTVDGSLKEPNVVITVDGEDRTDLFQPLVDPKKNQDGANGPVKFYTTVKYTYVRAAPSNELNQRNITCVATAENFPSRRSSAFLDVRYKPVITCPLYTIFAPKGDAVTVKCTLKSNPGAMVTWSYGSIRNQAMEIDTGKPDSKMSIKESPFNEDTTNLELIINKMTSKMFTNFYLTATNDIDTTEVEITLKRGAKSTPPPKYKPGNPPSNTVDNPGENPNAENLYNNRCARTATSVPLLVLTHLTILLTIWSLHK